MSGVFDTIGISGSGLLAHRKWLDAVSDNMANINTVNPYDEAPFRERLIEVEANEYGSGTGGVRTARAAFGGDPEGRVVYEPDHPMANEEGYVRYPDIDLGDQMVQLLMAQRGYQANLAVVERATQAYQAALQLGEALMTSPLGGLTALGVGAPNSITSVTNAGIPALKTGEGGDGFAATLAAVFDQLQGAQNTSSQLATQAATGDLKDVHDYMIASTEAGLATEMVVTIKNKAVEAFNEIMRMPV